MWTLWNKIYLIKNQFLNILWSEVWKGGFHLIQILGLLGMYFDAAVVEVKLHFYSYWVGPYCDGPSYFWPPRFVEAVRDKKQPW